jgi:CDGSH-type Zn-finger protein
MPTKITVKTNGSIKVDGDFELFDASGNKFDLGGRTAISLCRCGLSKDMPFCDSIHKELGFKSEVVARVVPPPIKEPLTKR